MKSVHDLTNEELEELRDRFYHQSIDDGSLDEIFEKEINSAEDIPMDLVKSHYEDYFFVEEDFFCNLKDD